MFFSDLGGKSLLVLPPLDNSLPSEVGSFIGSLVVASDHAMWASDRLLSVA
jgi:hypothetical protein